MKLKDKRIELIAATNMQDEEGYPVETLTTVATLWAYFRHLSGKEIFAASAVQNTEEVLFILNWRSDITPAHVIRYNGVLWNITRVDTFEGYKADLTVYAKRRR